MSLKETFSIFSKEHPEDTLTPLYTPWGETLDKKNPLPEYPRPQLRREDYHMLNGSWDYRIVPVQESSTAAQPNASSLQADTASAQPNASSPQTPDGSFPPDGQITVPFSPECLLSGVGHILQPDEYLWYQRTLTFSEQELAEKELLKKCCILHFGAVDQEAAVYLNGKQIAEHQGGYLPFHIDITEHITDTPLLLQVRVRDYTDTSYYSRGKQTLKRGGMFYTPQSGIWQSVWYEWVPEKYIEKLEITPDFQRGSVELRIHSNAAFQRLTLQVEEATSSYDDSTGLHAPKTLADTSFQLIHRLEAGDGSCVTILEIQFNNGFQAWTPDAPYLYPLHILADEDVVNSYFAMRCFTIEENDLLAPVFCLNREPLFLHGVLDQGYWSDGLMTAPSDEAFVFDIMYMKRLGFNMLRKHLKIEPLRWYYHCDRLGMVVWQDMVNGGEPQKMPFVCYLPTALPFLNGRIKDTKHRRLFSRESQEGRDFFEEECKETINHLYNTPSLAVWVPFNEAWGQFDAARIAENIAHQDPSRLVDHASGWYDQGAGDFRSVHNYFRKLKIEKQSWRAFCISEYGGYAYKAPDHTSVDRIYGYKKYRTTVELNADYHVLMRNRLLPLVEKGLSAAVYTQLSDVEEEVNGLLSYDRKVRKIVPPMTSSTPY